VPAAYLVQGRREESGAGGVYEFADSGVPTAAFDAPLWMTRLVRIAGFPAQGPFMALRGEDANHAREPVTVPASRVLLDPARRRDPNRGPTSRPGACARSRVSWRQRRRRPRAPRVRLLSRVVAEYENESRTGTIGDCVVCATGSTPRL